MRVNEQILELISEEVHKAYCIQYEAKKGEPYWTGGDYSKLDEATKEYDRVTVRAVLRALGSPPCVGCGNPIDHDYCEHCRKLWES